MVNVKVAGSEEVSMKNVEQEAGMIESGFPQMGSGEIDEQRNIELAEENKTESQHGFQF